MKWDTVPLTEVADIVMGQSPPSESYNQENLGVPFLQGNADFGPVFPTHRWWCAEPKKMARTGDVLLSVRAPVGAINIASEDACIGRGLSALRPRESLARQFLYHYVKSISHKLDAISTGSTFKAITKSQVSELPIPLPPIEEQKRISAILDEADRLRALRHQAIGKLDQLAQSIFLDMFGDPVTNPKGWETHSLESVVADEEYALKRGPFGGALRKDIFVPNGFKVYEQQHAIRDDFARGRYFVTESKYKEMRAFSVQPGDFIVSCSGTVGRIAQVPETAEPGIINQALLKIKIDTNKVIHRYFTAFWKTPSVQRSLFGSTHGSGIRNFPPMKYLKGFPVPLPPMEVQQRFSDILGQVFSLNSKACESRLESSILVRAVTQVAFKGDL